MIEFKTKQHDPIGMGTAKEEDGRPVLSRGLTKREYFAAMAMQGLCVPCIPGSHNANSPGESQAKAIMAVRIADALVEELNK